MRFFIFLAIIGGIIFYAFKALGDGEGIFSSFGGSGMISEKLGNPTRIVSDKVAAKKAERERQEAATAPPQPVKAETPPPAPVVAPVASGTSMLGILPPPPPKVTMTYRFRNRPPALSDKFTQTLGVEFLQDDSTRTVILRGEENLVMQAVGIVEGMDLSADSCVLRAWIVYADRSLGSGWDLTAAIHSLDSNNVGATVRGGTIALDLGGEQLAAALSVICDGESVDLVQRPVVALRHGFPAVVAVEQQVPVASSTLSGGGLSQSGVTYKDIGLSVEVKPFFLDRNRVVLDVVQRNGVLGASQDVGAGLKAPIIETQRLSSSVELAIGQSVVLGGVETKRLRRIKGIFSDKEEAQSAFVYVVLSTSSDAPRALQPGSHGVPLADTVPNASETLENVSALDLLLPPKDWEEQEREFVRARGAK